jgi:hypothetical protein
MNGEMIGVSASTPPAPAPALVVNNPAPTPLALSTPLSTPLTPLQRRDSLNTSPKVTHPPQCPEARATSTSPTLAAGAGGRDGGRHAQNAPAAAGGVDTEYSLLEFMQTLEASGIEEAAWLMASDADRGAESAHHARRPDTPVTLTSHLTSPTPHNTYSPLNPMCSQAALSTQRPSPRTGSTPNTWKSAGAAGSGSGSGSWSGSAEAPFSSSRGLALQGVGRDAACAGRSRPKA